MSPRSPRQLPASTRLAIGAVCVGIALLSWGCPPDLSCRELGCDSGSVCNRETGECEAIESDCTTSGCPDGEVCDRRTGTCRSATTRCPEQPCSSGQVCNTQTGFCQSDPDCSAGGCASPAEQCNESTGTCIPRPCDTDGQCSRGYICGRESTCTSGCRLDSPSCPPGTFCRSISGRTTGRCLPECTTDRDCPHGQVCAERDGQSVCQSEPPCRSDDDCRGDEVCRNSQCSRPPCHSAEDCPDSAVCDRPSGQCVGSDCREDMLAPNHTRSEAHHLEDFGSFAELRLCPARDDWFSIDADSAESLRFRLEHSARRDPDIYVYDARGRLLGANQQPPPTRTSGRFASTLEVTSHRDQILYLKVGAADRRSSTPDEQPRPLPPEPLSYDLTVASTEGEVCTDDDSEENDEPSDATELTTEPGVPSELEYQICNGDRDWFRLPDLSAAQGLRAGLSDAPDHLRLRILAPDGTRRVISPDERLEWRRIAAEGDWLLGVSSPRGRSGEYQLLWEVQRPWSCSGRGRHDAREKARPVGVDQRLSETLCPFEKSWEVDWLELNAPETRAAVDLTIRPAQTLPDLEISVFQQTDDGAAFVRRAVRREDAYRAIAEVEARPLFVRVHSNASVGRIKERPAYEIHYTFRPATP